MPNTRPAVLVHGILGFGPKELGPCNYWGSALRVHSPIDRHEASVGPLGSAHDRACELAAQIKGTRVDYGAAHARTEGHEQFGYDFTCRGFVPDWDEAHPIHLIGHSLGSPTVRCLQHLLEIDYWGWGSSHRWVSSISTLSGVSNGSTLVYLFDADERTGLLERSAGPTSILRFVELYTAATGGLLDSIYDFDLAYWGYERQPGESLVRYMARVAESDFLWGKDNAPYSLSLQGAYEDNGRWRTYPDTFYFSYVTEQTYRGWLTGRHYPELRMNPGMLAAATYIGQKEFVQAPIPDSGFDSSDWWENDGAVSTISQKYPHTNGDHPVGGEFGERTPAHSFEPGRWYFQRLPGVDHLDVCISPQPSQIGWKRRFYRRLYESLAALEIATPVARKPVEGPVSA